MNVGESPMSYRTVYDVLNDSLAAGREFGFIFLTATSGWLLLWILLSRILRDVSPNRPKDWRAGMFVGGFLVAVSLIVVATETYPALVIQSRCKEWLRQGDFQTVEGRIQEYHRDPGRHARVRFRVEDVWFEFRVGVPVAGGFGGTFTEPGTGKLTLRDGMRVRIAFHDAAILKIEMAE